MTENFDVNTLRENLHTNLSLVIKQIDEYSNKFINKLIDALQRNMSQNRLLDTKSDLKRVDYKIKNDIAKLADVLGHSNIDTTRIYIKSTGREHKRQLDKMNMIIGTRYKQGQGDIGW